MAAEGLKGLLGLAFRARQLAPGAEETLKLVREGRAGLVLLDPQASANTSKKISNACNHYRVQVILLNGGILGEACGRPGMAAAAIKNGSLCEQIRQQAGLTPDNQDHAKILEGKG